MKHKGTIVVKIPNLMSFVIWGVLLGVKNDADAEYKNDTCTFANGTETSQFNRPATSGNYSLHA